MAANSKSKSKAKTITTKPKPKAKPAPAAIVIPKTIATSFSTLAEQSLYERNKLIGQLMKIGHGDLALYTEVGLLAAQSEPELLSHFVAWNHIKGKIRDSKVAFPILALRGLSKADKDLAENAIGHILMLAPRDIIRAYDFNKKLVAAGSVIPGGWRELLIVAFRKQLELLESDSKRFDRVVLQHRAAIKRLYRIAHIKPSNRAQRVLFTKDYPRGSIFEKVAQLRNMTPTEAASTILTNKIPFEVAIGSVAKAKDDSIVLALLEGMTGNQIITNSKMLEKFGVMKNPVLKSAYEKALERAKSDKKLNVLKAGVAAESLSREISPAMSDKLINFQRDSTKKISSINGDWGVFVDASGSMRESIELGRKAAALIAERVSGKVYLIFFNTSPTFFDATGLSYDQIVEKTRFVRAGGGTSVGCAMSYIAQAQKSVDGIVIVSDGGDNTPPLFHSAYVNYCQRTANEPTVYHFHVKGDPNELKKYCSASGIQVETFDFQNGIDYYALPGLIETLRVNRYSLVDEVMETPLVSLDEVFNRKEKR